MQTIRWGIIGCGAVTEKKSGPAFQKAEHSELVAVMRRTPGLAEDYARRHRVPKWFTDADELINDPEVDAVYVATPPDTHKLYTLKAAAAGKPVYVEKPMARTHAECREMIAACNSAGIPLFVAYYRRALPRFLKVKELVVCGAIGQPRLVQVDLRKDMAAEEIDPENLPWRLVPQISGGGYFVDLASHTLDVLDFILGPIEQVWGSASRHGRDYLAEDQVSGHFRFRSGCMGIGSWLFHGNQTRDRVEITGEKGSIVFSTFGHEPVEWHNGKRVKKFRFARPVHIQQHLIQEVVKALLKRGKCSSRGESAARTSWVIDQFLDEYRRERGILFE